ncbi:MAG: uridine kinase [Bacteroidota bacterium]
MSQPLLIGIAGGSGSGKTRFGSDLQKSFPVGTVEIFSLDNYYRPQEEQPKDFEGEPNFDTPESFYQQRLFEDLRSIKLGNELQVPKYQFNIDRGADPVYITVRPTPIVLVEGIFTFYFQEVVDLLELKIFIQAPLWLMMKRRIERDEMERGYGDMKQTLMRFERHVAPAFNQYILPCREKSDIIIPNHESYDNALSLLRTYLSARLAEK